jgi:hypothetical protein
MFTRHWSLTISYAISVCWSAKIRICLLGCCTATIQMMPSYKGLSTLLETTPDYQSSPSAKRAESLSVSIVPSRRLRVFYWVVYGALILLAVGCGVLDARIGWLALAVSAGLAWLLYRRLGWWRRQHWQLQYDGGSWWLGSPGETLQPARLCGDVKLWRGCAFLTLADQAGKHSLVLLADSASPDSLRRLRMLLVTREG